MTSLAPPPCPAGGDDRLFNSPAPSTEQCEVETPPKLPPYRRLTDYA